MSDFATEHPGPMGWGIDDSSANEKHAEEHAHFEALLAVAPRYMMHRAPKDPNADLMAKVKSEMQADGIDDGFSFLHLEQAIFGSPLPWLPQLIGSCVASGGMRVVADRMLAEIFLFNDPEQLFGTKLVGTNNLASFAPYSYRDGRRIAGINGNGDGSLCLPHIRGLMQFGILPCSAQGLVSDALPEPQDQRLYRQWGASNGLMDRFAATAKIYPLVESTKTSSADESRRNIVDEQKPEMICSSWAFTPDRQHTTWRLRDGSPVWIYKRDTRNTWHHNMSRVAYVQVGGQWYSIILNSWGDRAHRNGPWFVIPMDLDHQWIRAADVQTIGEIDMSDNPPVFGDF